MDDNTNITDFQTDSTVIDTDIDGVKSGGGKPAVEPAPEKPEAPRKNESVRDSLEAEAKKLATTKDESGDDDQPDAKLKVDDNKKVEAKESAEAKAKVDANEPGAKETPKPSEGRKIIEAPARFLPRAKELWNNVPHPVREEWVRIEQEREAEVNQYREHKQFREELKDFEELAQRHNVPFKEALNNYVDIERKFSEDPATGFRQLCQNLGMTPPQAIGHILRSANVTPQQLVQHIQSDPNAYTGLAGNRSAPQQQVQQPQQRVPDPEVSAIKQELEAMRAERVVNDVIKPFSEEYPDYHANQDAIAKVLGSGIIEQIHGNGLSPRDKLEVALFMVVPHAKRNDQAQAANGDNSVLRSANSETPAVDLRGGNKSVRSSPGEVSDTTEPEKKMSMREMLEDEARKMGRRAS